MSFKYRMDMYEHLEKNKGAILDRAKKVPAELGIPKELIPVLGLSGGSATHSMLLDDSVEAVAKGARNVTRLGTLDAEVRRLVKSYYGDDYDAVVTSTAEAALWISYDSLYTPSYYSRGGRTTFRYIAPYERHMHHQAGYGSPVPPRYKDSTAERGVTPGELGVMAKRLADLETIWVRLPGADYTCHGINYHPCCIMRGVDAKASIAAIRAVAEVNRANLSGFASMGYETPGYGYSEKTKTGAPALMKGIGDIAAEFGVPYLIDNARGTPFIGVDIRATGADLMVYSTDKAFPGPTGGLLIGKEETIQTVRRALGIHGQRWGTGTSHGKAGYVMADPGKECLEALIPVLRILVNEPERLTQPADRWHEIVLDEFSQAKGSLGKYAAGFNFTKSYNSLGTEIDYEATWKDGMGFPIFSIEDMYSGSNLIQSGMQAMGLVPPLGYDASCFVGPGLGTSDSKGNLLEAESRYVLKAFYKLLAIIAETVDG